MALLWSIVRWWLAMWLVETLLRPGYSVFRLVPMGDACARQFKRISGVVLYVGIASISLLALLLRTQMPILSAQVVALMQGLVVAAGGVIGLGIYHHLELAPGSTAAQARRKIMPRWWFALAAVMVPVVWLAWSIGVMLLKFSIYHALVWSLRIAAFALIVDSVLGLSAAAPSEPVAPVSSWIPFAQKSIRVAAILAISILLAELWLVDELALIGRAAWEPWRRSLITAALTLVAGYTAWRYLNRWTEAHLSAATQDIDPTLEDGEAVPASRLTTVLPMLRVLFGITIVVLATLVALSVLGVNIGPLLAGAGVFGLAISFGSQALVRDVARGSFF